MPLPEPLTEPTHHALVSPARDFPLHHCSGTTFHHWCRHRNHMHMGSGATTVMPWKKSQVGDKGFPQQVGRRLGEDSASRAGPN